MPKQHLHARAACLLLTWDLLSLSGKLTKREEEGQSLSLASSSYKGLSAVTQQLCWRPRTHTRHLRLPMRGVTPLPSGGMKKTPCRHARFLFPSLHGISILPHLLLTFLPAHACLPLCSVCVSCHHFSKTSSSFCFLVHERQAPASRGMVAARKNSRQGSGEKAWTLPVVRQWADLPYPCPKCCSGTGWWEW